MKEEEGNIFTIFDELLQREDKEELLGQRSLVVWMTGLSGSGKTSIAKALERLLHDAGRLTMLLDGDNIRAGINKGLGFSEEDRQENIRRIAEVASLFKTCGVITICCFVSPTKAIRAQARDIIGEADFMEVFVDTPLQVCEQRDVKGLYKKARAGEIPDFTGISAPFEAPIETATQLTTEGRSIQDSATELFRLLQERIRIK